MVSMPEQQLRVTDLRVMTLGQKLTFLAVGEGIASLQVEFYTLSGRRVFRAEGEGAFLSVEVLSGGKNALANGVYLYVVHVRGFNGQEYVSEVRKLIVLR
jgi:hypothetical protein